MATLPKEFEFPFVENYDVQDSSFFRQGKELPTPDEVRARATRNARGELLLRPPLVLDKTLGLAVKFGNHVSIAEAHCLMFLRKHAPVIPVPELFGWRRDKRQTFIYMKCIDGFSGSYFDVREGEQPSLIAKSLYRKVMAVSEILKRIPQSLVTPVPFVGHVNGTHLRDWAIINSATPVSKAGPFPSVAAFHDWFAHKHGRPSSCDLPEEMYEQYRSQLPDDSAITLAHGGLTLDNLIVSRSGPGGAVMLQAVVDWSQAGWYPSSWNSYKISYADDGRWGSLAADHQGAAEAYTFFTLNAST